MKRTPTPAAFPWNSFVLCASFPVIPGRNELSTTDSLPHERRRETVETMYFCGLCSSLPSQRVCAGKKLSALLRNTHAQTPLGTALLRASTRLGIPSGMTVATKPICLGG